MKNFLCFICALFLLSCSSDNSERARMQGSNGIGKPVQITETLIDEFLDLSALRQEVQNVAAQTQTSDSSLKDSVNPSKTFALMKTYLHTELVKGNTAELMEWLRSPLARNMIPLVYMDVDNSAMQKFVRPSDPLRTTLVQRLDKVMNISETLLDASLLKSLSLMAALMPHAKTALAPDRINETIQQSKDMARHTIEREVTDKLLYQYQSASTDELTRIVKALESPLGLSYLNIRQGALDAGLASAKRQLAEGLKQLGVDTTLRKPIRPSVELTQTELDALVASQRYDKPIAFLRASHSPAVNEWVPRWWAEQVKVGHVPLTYEMARQGVKTDPRRSMDMFAIAYVGTVLDGSLCADPELRKLKLSLLQDYLKEWDEATSKNTAIAAGDFKPMLMTALKKGVAFHERLQKTPPPGWACRARVGFYDAPGGAVIPQSEWAAARTEARDPLAANTDADVEAQYAASYLQAAWTGKVEAMKRLLDRGVDIQTRSTERVRLDWSAMHIAARTGHLAVIDFLLGKGMDPNIQAKGGYTPLLIAANQGQTDAVALLLKRGAKVNAECERGTALQTAAIEGYADIVDLLLNAGADPNQRMSKDGSTALHAFSLIGEVRAGHAAIMENLLRHGAKVNAASSNGSMPLDGARREVIPQLILHGARVSNKNDYELLSKAAWSGSLQALTYLEKQGFSLSLRGPNGDTLLQPAVNSPDRAVLDYLLSKGLDPNIATRFGSTPLYMAAGQCKSDFVKVLLAHQANARYVDPYGKTLVRAAMSPYGNTTKAACQDVIRQLSDAGAPTPEGAQP